MKFSVTFSDAARSAGTVTCDEYPDIAPEFRIDERGRVHFLPGTIHPELVPHFAIEVLNERAVIERYVEADGTEWVRVWRPAVPGLEQLVWETRRDMGAPESGPAVAPASRRQLAEANQADLRNDEARESWDESREGW